MTGDLERLLPHRPPMVLLDCVLRAEGHRCVAGWTVPASSPWVERGRLLRAAFVEIAAQTAAAHSGSADVDADVVAGDVADRAAARSGALAAITAFRVHGDARPGDVLRATAVCASAFGSAAQYDCTIERVGDGVGTILAEGSITVSHGR